MERRGENCILEWRPTSAIFSSRSGMHFWVPDANEQIQGHRLQEAFLPLILSLPNYPVLSVLGISTIEFIQFRTLW